MLPGHNAARLHLREQRRAAGAQNGAEAEALQKGGVRQGPDPGLAVASFRTVLDGGSSSEGRAAARVIYPNSKQISERTAGSLLAAAERL